MNLIPSDILSNYFFPCLYVQESLQVSKTASFLLNSWRKSKVLKWKYNGETEYLLHSTREIDFGLILNAFPNLKQYTDVSSSRQYKINENLLLFWRQCFSLWCMVCLDPLFDLSTCVILKTSDIAGKHITCLAKDKINIFVPLENKESCLYPPIYVNNEISQLVRMKNDWYLRVVRGLSLEDPLDVLKIHMSLQNKNIIMVDEDVDMYQECLQLSGCYELEDMDPETEENTTPEWIFPLSYERLGLNFIPNGFSKTVFITGEKCQNLELISKNSNYRNTIITTTSITIHNRTKYPISIVNNLYNLRSFILNLIGLFEIKK